MNVYFDLPSSLPEQTCLSSHFSQQQIKRKAFTKVAGLQFSFKYWISICVFVPWKNFSSLPSNTINKQVK